MHDEGGSFEPGEELQYFSIVFEELLFRVDLPASQFLLEVLLHLGILFGDPLVSDCGGPLVILIRFRRALRLSCFFVELAGVVVAIVEVDGPAVEGDGLSESEIICGEELAVLLHVLFSFEELALGDTRILEFFLVDGDGIVLEVEEHLDLSISAILVVALHDALLEVSIEAQDMSVEIDPVWLVQLGGVLGDVLGIEVIV